jgi:hypothetical protein
MMLNKIYSFNNNAYIHMKNSFIKFDIKYNDKKHGSRKC